MGLTPGTRVGSYEVLSLIGAGGMGEVYRARDSKLNRDVALKVLPDLLADDPERLARLRREAQVLAALNEPHVAQIYGFEDSAGVHALVIELVEGSTLAEVIAGRALPVTKALAIARQIAEALDAAHEKGIVHRDLKPANVKITPSGVVKVLDFGLAKSASPTVPVNLTQSPTMMPSGTQPGVILGTAAYMSPEQARGLDVDKRADVWAFGCVLFEMLTGRQAFSGHTVTDILAAILEREPDLNALPAAVPLPLTRLLKRCLEKDVRRRLRDIGDARAELDESALASPASAPTVSTSSARRSRFVWPAVAGLVVVSGLAGWALASRRPTSDRPTGAVNLSLAFPGRPASAPFGMTRLAISDDGLRVAYAALNRLWIRRLNELAPTLVDVPAVDPFFSPDGQWVGFFTNDSALAKVPAAGGNVSMVLRTTERPAGAAWGPDGTIVFATTEGLYQIPESGGTPRLLVRPDRTKRERLYAWPQFTLDRKSVLYTILFEPSVSTPQIARLNLESLQSTVVQTGGTSARQIPGGYLVYASGRTLQSVRFDPATGRVQGDPVSTGIDLSVAADNGAANFAVSPNGTLVFMPADGTDLAPGDSTASLRGLQWIDRHGNPEPIAVQPAQFAQPRVSSDGTRVALNVIGNGKRNVWILDLKRLTLTQLTDGPTEDLLPQWSPDGRRVFFTSDRTGNFDIYSQSADGASDARVEFAGPGAQMLSGITPDGTRLLVYDLFKDQALLTIGKSDRLEPLLHGDADERVPDVSPDGRWLVYESNESGTQFEVFLRPFPHVSERREKISVNGGRFPHWSPNGREVYYVDLAGAMMAVPVTFSPAVTVGAAVKLFDYQKPPAGRAGSPYDVSPIDGRFLLTQPVAPSPTGPTTVSVTLNWLPELARRMEAGSRK